MAVRIEQHADGQIPVTRWSLIDRAGQMAPDARRVALGEFLVRYLPAMRSHLVYRRGWGRDDVEDVLQGFASERLLQGDVLARADRGRRFRNYFLTVLDNYAANLRRAGQAQKRAAERGESLDAQDEHGGEPAAGGGGADVFDLEWARQVLAESMRRMRQYCESNNRVDLWEVFDGRIRKPLLEDAQPIAYDELVQRFGLRTAIQAANLLTSAKRAFERALREVVGEYSQSDEQVDDEIRDLIDVLGGGRGTR